MTHDSPPPDPSALQSDFHTEVARLLRVLPTIAIDVTDRELDRHLRDRVRPPPRAGAGRHERRFDRPARLGAEAPPELLRAEEMLDAGALPRAISLLLGYVDAHVSDVAARPLLRYAAVRRLAVYRPTPWRAAYAGVRLARACGRDDSMAALYWSERVLLHDPADVATMVIASTHALRLRHPNAAAWIAYDALAVDAGHRGALRAAIAAERARRAYDAAVSLARELARVEPDDPEHARTIDRIVAERAVAERFAAAAEERRLAAEARRLAAGVEPQAEEDAEARRRDELPPPQDGRMTESTIILPSGGREEESKPGDEPSDVLLIEDDTAETLRDVDELDGEKAQLPGPRSDRSADQTGSMRLREQRALDEESSAAFEIDAPGGKDAVVDDDSGSTTEPLQLRDDDDDADFGRAAAAPPPASRPKAAAPPRPAAGRAPARPEPTDKEEEVALRSVQRGAPPARRARAVAAPAAEELKAATAAGAIPKKKVAKGLPAKTPEPVAQLPERAPVRFERWIADDAGRPGPVERVLAQSTLILRALRVFVGLRLVAIAALADVVVETATSYARGIQSAWLAWRTLSRRMARRGREAAALATDLAQARGQLWRLMRFRGEPPPAELAHRAPAAFDLELVLATRAHLDQMSRDLKLLTPRSAGEAARKTIVGFVVSFIPNPFELVGALKDWVVLAFALRYDRRAVEAAYADLLAGARQLVRLAERASPAPEPALMALHPAEALLLSDHGLPVEPNGEGALEPWIEQVESRLQRLIAALFAPQRAIDPRHWARADVVRELRHATARGIEVHAPLASECERWVVGLVQRRWIEHGERPSSIERGLRKAEDHARRVRWRESRRLLRHLA